MRGALYTLRILGVILAVIISYLTYFILLPPDIWNISALSDTILLVWASVGFYGLYFSIYGITMAFPYLLSSPLGYSNPDFIRAITFEFIVKSWNIPTTFEIPKNIFSLNQGLENPSNFNALIHYFTDPFVYSAIIFVGIVVGLSFISYIFTQNPRDSAVLTAALLATIIMGVYLGKVNIQYFNLHDESFTSLITSLPFLVLLLYFLFFEYGMYLGYIKEVLGLGLTRESVVKHQLKVIEDYASRTEIEAGTLPLSTYTKAKHSVASFAFVREILEKRIFRRSRDVEDVITIHEVRKLNTYVNQLKQSDSNTLNLLMGKFAVPKPHQIILTSILSFVGYTAVLTYLAFYVLNPVPILEFLTLPTPIINSAEIGLPEISILLLLPIALSLPVIANIITYMKYVRYLKKKKEKQVKK